MKKKVLNAKTITYSVIAIAAMLTLSNCNKVKHQPKLETADQSLEQFLLNPNAEYIYEKQVTVYDKEKKNYLTCLVKSNSESEFEAAVKSLKDSKIEVFDPPKVVNSETIHATMAQTQPALNSKSFLIIKVVNQSFVKGKAVRLSVNSFVEDATANTSVGENRTDQFVAGNVSVSFYYYGSSHQIFNYWGTVHYQDYRVRSGIATLIEDFNLGQNTNHNDSQGQNDNRILVATRTGVPNNIAFDITYW